MSIEAEIGVDGRRRRLSKVPKCYDKASRKERGRLLDEMETVTGLLSKSSIRLLTGSLKRKPRH